MEAIIDRRNMGDRPDIILVEESGKQTKINVDKISIRINAMETLTIDLNEATKYILFAKEMGRMVSIFGDIEKNAKTHF